MSRVTGAVYPGPRVHGGRRGHVREGLRGAGGHLALPRLRQGDTHR